MGTLIPNRIFVGGLPPETTEEELKNYFSKFGQVKDVKVIVDKLGLSKGTYGFVTFESQNVAQKIINEESDTLVFQDRKLNISFAIKKNHSMMRPEVSSAALLLGSTGTASLPLAYPSTFNFLPCSSPVTLPGGSQLTGNLDPSTFLTPQHLQANMNHFNNANLLSSSPVEAYLTAASIFMSNPNNSFYLSNGVNAMTSSPPLNALQLTQQTLAAQQAQQNVSCQINSQNVINSPINNLQQSSSSPINFFPTQQTISVSQQPVTGLPNIVIPVNTVNGGQTSPDVLFNQRANQPQGLLNPLSPTGQDPYQICGQKACQTNLVFVQNNSLPNNHPAYLTGTPIRSGHLKNRRNPLNCNELETAPMANSTQILAQSLQQPILIAPSIRRPLQNSQTFSPVVSF